MSGIPFEYAVAGYFQAHGFAVFRGVPLVADAGATDVTDLDVFGVRFGLPLEEQRAIIDCKDRKKPKPFQRIVWTCGARDIAGVHGAFVALPKFPQAARDFAESHGIRALTGPVLASFYEKSGYRPFGEADPSLHSLREKGIKALLKRDRDAYRDWNLAASSILGGHPATNINLLADIAASFRPTLHLSAGPEDVRTKQLLRARMVNAFALNATRLVARTAWWSPSEARDYAADRLKHGDADPQMFALVAGSFESKSAMEAALSPRYADECLELFELLREVPHRTRFIPLATDLILAEGDVAFNKDDPRFRRLFPQTSAPDLLSLTKKVVSVGDYVLDFQGLRSS